MSILCSHGILLGPSYATSISLFNSFATFKYIPLRQKDESNNWVWILEKWCRCNFPSARNVWKFVLNLLWLLDRFWAYLLVKLNCSHVALHCLPTWLKYLLFSLEKNLVCSISFTFLKFWNQNNILLRILRFPAKNFEFDWLSTLTKTQLAQCLTKNHFRKMKKLQTKWPP